MKTQSNREVIQMDLNKLARATVLICGGVLLGGVMGIYPLLDAMINPGRSLSQGVLLCLNGVGMYLLLVTMMVLSVTKEGRYFIAYPARVFRLLWNGSRAQPAVQCGGASR